MSTKSHEAAVAHIPPDEPIFIIRAQDKYAQDIITHWQILNIEPGTLEQRCSPEKWAAVESALQEIADWQRENPDKVKQPD